MRKILSIALCLTIVFSLSSCNNPKAPNEDYYDGYIDGYNVGISNAQKSISNYAEERFNEINVEEAIQVLRNYADGEPISEDELHDAIWTVNQFYNEAWDVIWK